MNKTFLKLAGLPFGLAVFNGLVVLYWWIRYQQTHSEFYFEAFEFGGIFISLGIPTLILFGLSLILLIAYKWYKKEASSLVKLIVIVLVIVIFIIPYVPFLLPSEHSKTYKEFLYRAEQKRIESEREKERQCLEYRREISEHQEGQPISVPPYPECN